MVKNSKSTNFINKDPEKSDQFDNEIINIINKDLKNSYRAILLTNYEMSIRFMLFNKLKKMIELEIDCKVKCYGSFRTSTMVYSSDLDITVLVKANVIKNDLNNNLNNINTCYLNNKKFENIYLTKIYKILYSKKISSVPIIHLQNAKCPIIRFKEKYSNISVDISINGINGIKSANFICKTISEVPYIKYFIIIVKYILKRKGLSDTSLGGLCSYGQFLMILKYLQMNDLMKKDEKYICDNLTIILYNFFQFYGIEFDYRETAISVIGDNNIVKSIGGIYIQDPIIPGNNVTLRCINFHSIRDVFIQNLKCIRSGLNNKCKNTRIVDVLIPIDKKELQIRAILNRKKKKQ